MQKIMGRDWKDIQAMQNKTHIARVVDTSRRATTARTR